MAEVIVAGHVCVDLTPTLPRSAAGSSMLELMEPGRLIEVGEMRIRAGGCVANTGRELQRLGHVVRAVGRVGGDALAELLSGALRADGIDPSGLAADAASSTSYSVVVENDGRDRTFWHHTGANARFTGEEVQAAGAVLVHLGYPPLLPATLADAGAPIGRLFGRCRADGATTSLDLAVVDPSSPSARVDWRALLHRIGPVTDVLTPSFDDLRSALGISAPYSPGLVDGLLDELITAGVGIVAISAGEHGLHLGAADAGRLAMGGPVLAGVAREWAGVRLHAPAQPVLGRVTTNGAGDASTAGLLAALLDRAPPNAAAARAAASAVHAMRGGVAEPVVNATGAASQTATESTRPRKEPTTV